VLPDKHPIVECTLVPGGGADRTNSANRAVGPEEQGYDTKLMMYMLLIRRSEEGVAHVRAIFRRMRRIVSLDPEDTLELRR
jgi:hypothetical protein